MASGSGAFAKINAGRKAGKGKSSAAKQRRKA